MTFDQLQNLINEGFSRDDLISMGILQTAPAAPAAEPAPSSGTGTDTGTDPSTGTGTDAGTGLTAEQALMALVTKLDARLDQIQAANIAGAGMQTPDQKKTAEQVLTELIMPTRKE